MYRILFWLALIPSWTFGQSYDASGDPLIESENNRTPTWEETVLAYSLLADAHEQAVLIQIGRSDVGRPIHAFVCSETANEIYDLSGLQTWRKKGRDRLCMLVNNAIHPGEPCGVDASFHWIQRVLDGNSPDSELLSHMDIVIIPMYNVGGALNRNCCSRTNQNGPEAYGFRGNGRNLDLNRDFVKMDSQNARAFTALFHALDPDLFVDTHTSNGADYSYTMTLITTQADKAGPLVGEFLRKSMEPAIYAGMKSRGWPTVPYVNSKSSTPNDGIIEFLETPRYSTGYTTLFGTLGFTSEAHMLKPFPDRVKATQALLEEVSSLAVREKNAIRELRILEKERLQAATILPVHWKLDAADSTMLLFEGYTSRQEISAVTRQPRLKYDRSNPWRDSIPFFNSYIPDVWSEVPAFWIVPQAWSEVLDRLEWNGVIWERLEQDSVMELRVQYIEGMTSSSSPYEGHHPNRMDSLLEVIERVQLFQGDVLIRPDQPALRYLVETLDPRGHDSFFVWNFFDSAMQQKEYFSSYVFEDTAARLLKENPDLALEFQEAKASGTLTDSYSQLNWLYQRSDHFEGSVNRYPVYRSLIPRQ